MENIIEKLFFDYQQTEEYAQDFDTMPGKDAIRAAQDKFVEPFKEDYGSWNKRDNVLTGALCAMEDFGFVQGFKFAMRLRDECNNKKPTV